MSLSKRLLWRLSVIIDNIHYIDFITFNVSSLFFFFLDLPCWNWGASYTPMCLIWCQIRYVCICMDFFFFFFHLFYLFILIFPWTVLMINNSFSSFCSVSCGCRIHWLHLCIGVRPPAPNECPDTKQSAGEVPAVLELWRMRSTSLLPLLPGPLWPGVVAPDRALSMGQIELTAYLR